MRNIIIVIALIGGMLVPSFSCTIGIFSGEATADGRPMLWKNRDVPNAVQQYIFVEDEHDFVAITYQSAPSMAYGGANSAGFGIVNTDTYNHGGWDYTGLSDGEVMFMALNQCETVWDFMDLLDSLLMYAPGGLRSTHCYGVMDRYGNAIAIEASCTHYVYYSALSAPEGFLIRTNFAVSGDDSDRRGWERYTRARAILEPMASCISYRDVISTASDLVTTELDPNPLPYDGTYEDLPYGYISTEYTINRYYTTSYQVIIGAYAHEYPTYPVMWSGFGQPCATIPTPLWVGANEIPAQVTGNAAQLCADGRFITAQIYDEIYPTCFNTFTADRIADFLQPIKNEVFDWYDNRANLWTKMGSCPESLAMGQQLMCEWVGGNYEELRGLFIRENQASIPQNLSVKPYPNPFNSSLAIEVTFPNQQPVDIAIVDIGGRIVYQEKMSIIDSGLLQWEPNESVPSGIYLIKASSSSFSMSSKVIFAR